MIVLQTIPDNILLSGLIWLMSWLDFFCWLISCVSLNGCTVRKCGTVVFCVLQIFYVLWRRWILKCEKLHQGNRLIKA